MGMQHAEHAGVDPGFLAAATQPRTALQRQLYQVEVTALARVNVYLGAITENVERHLVEPDLVVPRLKGVPTSAQIEPMR